MTPGPFRAPEPDEGDTIAETIGAIVAMLAIITVTLFNDAVAGMLWRIFG